MNNYRRYKEMNYYSLFDVIQQLPYDSENMPTLKTILDDLGIANSLTSGSLAEDLWTLIYARYYKDYCIISEEELTSDNVNDYVYALFVKIWNIYNFTKDKYETLLTIYNSSLSDLMNPVHQVSDGKVRFNDTPQDNGTFEDSTHTTNVTLNHLDFDNDMKTKMERIKEIQDSFDNVMFKWVREFDRLFISESEVY